MTYAFAPVGEWPKRGRIARERTPEELELRGVLIAALADHVAGVRDPETYADDKAARNAAARYRGLLDPVMPEGQRMESAVTPSGKRFALQMRLSAAKVKEPKG